MNDVSIEDKANIGTTDAAAADIPAMADISAMNGPLVLMRHIVDAHARDTNSLLRPLGITVGMAGALAAIEESPEGHISIKQLERMRHTSQPVTLGMVGRLEKRGLVQTYVDPNDARAKIVAITTAGRHVLSGARFAMMQGTKNLLSRLNAEERAELGRLLRKISDGAEL
ncbi:MarR family transcriptional regulator [Bifidobacterium margollesii]|uniref:MarR family transcriptional regulator n=1 Tax=Bifidobacterium margollesii TaxID=2020964 RepID=A0A2N5JB84_9BIFI|nr:MarR family transcriptional regulator [Bifidobacterium margollesii]PLS31473.1 MarR family transcriptional regulator [Bifidobacterium margollesii]